MQPRSEPLLWLQCLALGAIPLELLLIRLVLAGADPGPVPGVERFLIWGVGVLAPAVALWRRPADWGSLLLVRQPLASRNSDQLRISASHGGLSSRAAVVIAAVILLPVLWWMDDSAVLASEFSPVSGQSRLVTLLLVSPLLALMVWQVQQLIQAAALLLGSPATVAPGDSAFRSDAVATQRTSLGLQLLNLHALEWPEPAVEPIKREQDKVIGVEDTELETDDSTDQANTENEAPDDESSAVHPMTAAVSDVAGPETTPKPVVAEAQAEDIDPTGDQDADEAISLEDTTPEPDDSTEDVSAADMSSDNEEPENQERDDESSVINTETTEEPDEAEPEALEPVDAEDQDDMSEDDDSEDIRAVDSDESSVAAAVPVAVEPEQSGEEQESTPLNAEVSQIDSVAGGDTESHREQAESSGGKESKPDEPSEPTPGGL
ncbi:AAA ATPase containing von Willebrand factor type A (vWA) domain [Synechococcus sp. WH 8109]|nr:AAA ATPase containing von Willebrand factor type A (vWA) domain [Synechococcus sp. WH 8109]